MITTSNSTTTIMARTTTLHQSDNLVLHPTQSSYPVKKDEHVEQYLVRERDELEDSGQVGLDGDAGDGP